MTNVGCKSRSSHILEEKKKKNRTVEKHTYDAYLIHFHYVQTYICVEA